MSEAFVQLFCEVRSERCQHDYQRLQFGARRCAPALASDIQILHHCGNCRVVLEFRHLLGELADGLVHRPLHLPVRRIVTCREYALPQPVEKSIRPLNAFALIVTALLVRSQEQQVHAHRVRTIFGNDIVRDDDVTLALRHLSAFADEQPVRAKTGKGFVEFDHP